MTWVFFFFKSFSLSSLFNIQVTFQSVLAMSFPRPWLAFSFSIIDSWWETFMKFGFPFLLLKSFWYLRHLQNYHCIFLHFLLEGFIYSFVNLWFLISFRGLSTILTHCRIQQLANNPLGVFYNLGCNTYNNACCASILHSVPLLSSSHTYS